MLEYLQKAKINFVVVLSALISSIAVAANSEGDCSQNHLNLQFEIAYKSIDNSDLPKLIEAIDVCPEIL